MYPRIKYRMTQADCDSIMKAIEPEPCIMVGEARMGMSQQERANNAWAELGARMGFDAMTVEPIAGGSVLDFTAVPTETESQRAERVAKETSAARLAHIAELEAEIVAKQAELTSLKGPDPVPA